MLTCPPEVVLAIFSIPDLTSTFAPLYIAIPISALIYGVTCAQAYNYCRSEKAKKDHWSLWILVGSMMLLSTVQEALIIADVYNTLVAGLIDPCKLASKISWTFPVEAMMNGILELGAEGFLIYRTYRLSRNIWVAALCSALTLAGSILTWIVPAKLLKSNDPANIALANLKTMGMVNTGVVALGDAFTTAMMLFYLYRNRTGFRRTNNLVTKLVILTVATGALTVLVSLGEFIGWAVNVVFFNFLIGKMYVNSLLATLNMREAMTPTWADSTTEGINSIHLSRIKEFSTNGGSTSSRQTGTAVASIERKSIISHSRSSIFRENKVEIPA